VVWKDRTSPGKRKIPKHLKLAILSRGRVRLPLERVKWLLDANKNLPWVQRLPNNLREILPEVDVTVELFMRQQLLSREEISSVLQSYLTQRHQKELPGCHYFAGYWVWAEDATPVETALGVSLTMLFQRPNAPVPQRMRSQDKRQFIFLAYISFHSALERLLLPPKKPKVVPSPPPPIEDRMPPLAGITSHGFYNLRTNPKENDDTLIGQMLGTPTPVTVTGKMVQNGGLWYRITLNRKMRVKKDGRILELPEGTQCWVIEPGLMVVVVEWNYFRNQLIQFEEAYKNLSLSERITKLRQIGHAQDVPFDKVIGTPKGDVYKDTRPASRDQWQLLKDYQAVRAPDGVWIDIFHVLVGLDVLRKSEEQVLWAGMDIGTNYAAATWSGDIGAAAADATLKISKAWEDANPKATEGERIKFYYDTRVPEWDLLADIDAWGVHALRLGPLAGDLNSIDKLLAFYYQNTRQGALRRLTTQRKKALERFLRHYGFKYSYERHIRDYPALKK
jgi:hypothetical protein